MNWDKVFDYGIVVVLLAMCWAWYMEIFVLVN